MDNLTKESKEFLKSQNAEILTIEDSGMYSGVRVKLSNGLEGVGYYPAWKPLDLNISSFKIKTGNIKTNRIEGSPDWENIAFNNNWTSFEDLDENEKTAAKFKFPKLFDETEGLPYGYYFETDQAGDVFKYAEAEDPEQLCRDLSLGIEL